MLLLPSSSPQSPALSVYILQSSVQLQWTSPQWSVHATLPNPSVASLFSILKLLIGKVGSHVHMYANKVKPVLRVQPIYHPKVVSQNMWPPAGCILIRQDQIECRSLENRPQDIWLLIEGSFETDINEPMIMA